MKKQIYLDAEGEEVEPKKAVRMIEAEYDGDKLIKETFYVRDPEELAKLSDKQNAKQ